MSDAGQSGGTGPLLIEEICDALSFARLRPEWNALLSASEASPFLSWDWLFPYWRRIAPRRTPRLVTARDPDGTLVGVLPLSEVESSALGVPVRRWAFLGDRLVGSDGLDALSRLGREREVADRFAEHVVARLSTVDVLELVDLPRGSLFADRVLERLSGRALRVERGVVGACPRVEVRSSFGSYLDSVGRAENLARRRKWLVAQPGFGIERAERPEAIGAALADFFRLHRLRWEREDGSRGIPSPEVRAFHRDATSHLAESGRLRIYTLRIGDTALASVYAIVEPRRLSYYQSGYDPRWMRRSAGLVLLGEVIGDAFREGKAVFDFLRGEEPYKHEWANASRELEAVRVVNRTPGGMAFFLAREGERRLKRSARRLLGDRLWERARRAADARGLASP
jgi:CelD/BcsL family acetyltransferase involved in cellulose biosynthesis